MAVQNAGTSFSLKRLIPLLILAAGVALFYGFGLDDYVTFDSLREHRETMLALVAAHSLLAPLIFMAVYVAVVAFSLPGGAIMTLAGGFLFGSFLGTLLVNVGATTGATLGFLSARYLLRDWVEKKFGDRLEPIQAGFAQNAFSYLMTLRLIPAFPFFLVNLVSGLTRIKVGTYITATSQAVLDEGMVFSIEPGIYLPGRFGIRLEDIVILRADGPEILSELPRNLKVIHD